MSAAVFRRGRANGIGEFGLQPSPKTWTNFTESSEIVGRRRI
jgi:hypothetical protein